MDSGAIIFWQSYFYNSLLNLGPPPISSYFIHSTCHRVKVVPEVLGFTLSERQLQCGCLGLPLHSCRKNYSLYPYEITSARKDRNCVAAHCWSLHSWQHPNSAPKGRGSVFERSCCPHPGWSTVLGQQLAGFLHQHHRLLPGLWGVGDNGCPVGCKLFCRTLESFIS